MSPRLLRSHHHPRAARRPPRVGPCHPRRAGRHGRRPRGLAPITLFIYFSTADYRAIQLFNGAIFAVASAAAQLVIRRHYRPLIAKDPRHRITLTLWAALYIFTGIQMAWTLRPFIGRPGVYPTFFRDEPFTNAYVVIFDLIARYF